ncbi:hypothetical protein [Acidovorax sp.]|uniref:hypothetical protein n=1 Tax=Acidovorax sp. TaxID=1872122 RepID=UPI00391F726B
MNSVQYALRIRPRIEREMRAEAEEGEFANEDAFQAAVDAAVQDEVAEAERDAAQEREMFGGPEDTPSIQSADLYGTGEGRYHGLI